MPNKREQENESYHYSTCGLLAFIVFFLGAFIFFIVAEEADKVYNYMIFLGSTMLCVSLASFYLVISESKRIQTLKPEEPDEPQPEQGLMLQPQLESQLPPQPQLEPELSGKPKIEPHWYNKTRLDFAYVRQVLGLPPMDSNETTSSENDSDPDILELRKMARCGLPADGEEPMAGTSKEVQDNDTTRCESEVDFQMDSIKFRPSKDARKSSEVTESRYDDLPLKDMSALSLSGPSKYTAVSEEKKADVSAALSRLCLDSSENEATKMAAYDKYSTDSEDKSDDQYVETSMKLEDNISSNLESKKEA